MVLSNKRAAKRLVIYYFSDKDGIVDNYVTYLLNDMKKNCSEIFVVCNGKLTSEGRAIFQGVASKLLVREDEGYDVWAYKAVIEEYGWKKISAFDEVVFMNHCIMGPVYPFSEIFEEMNQRDVDFWGITKHESQKGDIYGLGLQENPEYIQDYFLAVRRNMLNSCEFKAYWDNCPPINSYIEKVVKHELLFTKRFGDKGFVWDTYIDTKEYASFTQNSFIFQAEKLIKDHRCPVFSKSLFDFPLDASLCCSSGDQGRRIIEYLSSSTDYDVNMIWDNILRVCHMADIKNALNLNYIFPKRLESKLNRKIKTALVIHQYFPDLIEYCYQYALSMPEDSDIYITTNSEKKVEGIKTVFEKGPWNKVEVIVIENRGRDVSALLVGAAPYIMDYDYVCFMHDKKVSQMDYGIKGYNFSERCFENMLGSKAMVNNILNLFEREKRLGLICPPPPNHADYYPTLGIEWGPNFEKTKELADKLDITVPMDISREPIAPLGTMFWFRTAAMKPLIERGWKYNDFPAEPIMFDGTILHAIERIYAFVVQQEGYYCAWGVSDDYARTEWTNLAYMLREMNTRTFRLYGPNSHAGILREMDIHGTRVIQPKLRVLIKRRIKKYVPKCIWSMMKKIYHVFGGKKWIG